MDVGMKSALEKLRRKIKRKRAWMLAGLLAVILAAALIYPFLDTNHAAEPTITNPEDHGKSEVVLHRIFVCGEQFEPLGYLDEKQLEAMRSVHPDWKLEGIDGSKVVLAVEVDDLSPECRQNAYFGLDANHSLTLYEGKPAEGKIVRTFFQVNIEHLENSLPQETVSELYEGIKVTDFAEYNSVLSTFSDYALDEAEQVVQPNH